jgi:hypothetical protein
LSRLWRGQGKGIHRHARSALSGFEMLGRLIKATKASGAGRIALLYVVAEPSSEKALEIVKSDLPGARIEDKGGVSERLVNALSLAPGQFVQL